ncbi:hypothetical protein I0D00_05200 [Pseudomonas lalucatii]|uniref:Cobalamin ABC transporter n=1 Tax=Pseudomonas lalucatii TaxID=1424203 RepID=A0ABS5PXY7_9PSED|nr:hypothetical protein [Pseudomonas lalucatii]MBS7661345.1 hypothetical protein [Pseudomonas lalucatii]MBS7691737.1 hypothetical protein [Pseudomonas lalucatii]MBS7724149.1 hypothetical protein [Pseudomonas lalucatii]QVM87851.1 hypothetical protein I0D68_02195 [Pseudomonas lalucatii]
MPKLSPSTQLLLGLALAALLAMTRGQHFATLNLPSASWAVFFLAGVLLTPRWVFPALFAEASLLDLAAMQWSGVSDWCLSPAYWLLLPAYASLWLGGRLYAGRHRDSLQSLALLAATAALSAFVAYLFSGGGFLFFSGRYAEPSLALLVERIAVYYPRYLGNLALYLGLATLLYGGARSWQLAQRRAEVQG